MFSLLLSLSLLPLSFAAPIDRWGAYYVEDPYVTTESYLFAPTEYPFQPDRPIYCISGPFDAGFSHPFEDVVFLFKEDRYYRVVKMVPGPDPSFPVLEAGTNHELRISEAFPGLRGTYDAAVTDATRDVTYFFQNHKVTSWDWAAGRIGEYYKEPLERTIFAGIPGPITAATRYRDYFIFFTGYEMYYIFSMRSGRLNPEPYMSPLSDDDDMPPDAAFHSFFNGVMYTLYGDVYSAVQGRKLAAGAETYDEAYKTAIEGWIGHDIEQDFGLKGQIAFCGRD